MEYGIDITLECNRRKCKDCDIKDLCESIAERCREGLIHSVQFGGCDEDCENCGDRECPNALK